MNIARISVIGVLIVAIAASIYLLRFATERDTRQPGAPLQVDELAKDPKRFADQTVTVEGVVSAVVPKQGVFVLIDQAEYADCEVVTCAVYQVPVAFSDTLPELEEAVAVTGHLVEAEPGRFVVQAARVSPLQ